MSHLASLERAWVGWRVGGEGGGAHSFTLLKAEQV